MQKSTKKKCQKTAKEGDFKVKRPKMVLWLLFFKNLHFFYYNLWNFHDLTCLGRVKIGLSKREICLTLIIPIGHKSSKRDYSVLKWWIDSCFFRIYTFFTITSEIFMPIRVWEGSKTGVWKCSNGPKKRVRRGNKCVNLRWSVPKWCQNSYIFRFYHLHTILTENLVTLSAREG